MSLQNLYAKLHEFEKKSKAEAADSDKRAAWSRVQQNTELADFLRECKAEFGKPDSVRIEIDGNEIWRHP